MSDERRTKAQLLEEIETLKYKVANPEKARAVEVPEGVALSECIRALDKLPRTKAQYGSVTYTYRASGSYTQYDGQVDLGTVRRILAHLADRFGVALTNVVGTGDES